MVATDVLKGFAAATARSVLDRVTVGQFSDSFAPFKAVTHFACGCCSNGKELTDEQKQLRCQGLFDEFLQNVDVNEAVLCAQELATPGELPSITTCHNFEVKYVHSAL